MRSVSYRFRSADFALALLGLALVLGVAGCGSSNSSSASAGPVATVRASTTASGKPIHIALLAASAGNTFVDAAIQGAKDEAQRVGATITVFDNNFDPAKQLADCQDALTQKTYQAIVVTVFAGPPLIPCAAAAQKAGVPLVAHNNPIGTNLSTANPTTPGVTAQVLAPLTTLTTSLAQEVGKACARVNPCNVAWLRTTKTLPQVDALLSQALQTETRKSPNVRIVAQGDAGLDAQGGITTMQNLLQRTNNINVVVSYGAQSMEGAVNALQAAGKHPGKDVKLVSEGGTQLQIKGVRDGTYFSSGLVVPHTEAKLAVDQAVAAARGESYRRAIDPIKALGLPYSIDQSNKGQYPNFQGEWPR